MTLPKIRSSYQENSLFRSGIEGLEDLDLNACVGNNGGPYGLGDYAFGYFQAGRRIAQSILDNSIYSSAVIYPLVFTYRHAIELSLKELAQESPQLFSKKSTFKKTHKIQDLWCGVKPYLERCKELDPQGVLIIEVDNILNDFWKIDNSSETFRYPTNQKDMPHLQELGLINIGVFLSAMIVIEEAFMHWIEGVQDLLCD